MKIQEIIDSKTPTEVAIPMAAVPSIIGSKGSNIRAMEAESGARIDVDKNRNVVILRGTPDAREKASSLIREKLAAGNFEELPAEPVSPVPKPVLKSSVAVGAFDFLSEDVATRNYNKEKRVAKQMAFKLMQSHAVDTAQESHVASAQSNGSLKDPILSEVSNDAQMFVPPKATTPIAAPTPMVAPQITTRDDEEINFFGSLPPGMSPPTQRKADLPLPPALPIQPHSLPEPPTHNVSLAQQSSQQRTVSASHPDIPIPTAVAPELDANAAFLLNLLGASSKSNVDLFNPEKSLQSIHVANTKPVVKHPLPTSVAPPGLSRTPSDDGYGKRVVSQGSSAVNYSKAVSHQTSSSSSSSSDKYFKSKSGFSVRL